MCHGKPDLKTISKVNILEKKHKIFQLKETFNNLFERRFLFYFINN